MNIFKEMAAIEKQAAEFGFKWFNHSQILEQIISECKEIAAVADHTETRNNLQDEIGDLLHATLCLCLFCGFDPLQTLEKSLQKFQKRFTTVVNLAKEAGYTSLENQPFELLMQFWDEAKKLVG